MARRPSRKDRKDRENVAGERVDILFNLASECAREGDLERADRYVDIARRIGMRVNKSIPGKYKRSVCKHCYAYLVPGRTSKSRLDSANKRVQVTCIKCGEKMFYPYRREKSG